MGAMLPDAERYTEPMHDFIGDVLDDIGPRESCGAAERRLAERLVDGWRTLGFAARLEPFTCHPKAFLGFIPYAAFFYLMATIFYWLAPVWATLFAAAALVITVLELLAYKEFVDPLFPAAEGANAVAVVRPRGNVRRRVVVSAHIDSAYEFNLWFFLKNAGIPVMVIAFAAPLVPLAGGLLKLAVPTGTDPALFDTIGYLCLALYPIVGLNFFFHTYHVVPGAMDDLAGVAVVDATGRALAAAIEADEGLQSTEVVLLGAAAEEAGLRGAKRFVTAHEDTLSDLPSYGIFVDGVYDERHLAVVRRELTTGARHDPRLVDLAREVAERRRWPMREVVIPFGATDASAFSTAGIPAIAVLCQDTSQLAPNYHTRLDVLENVRPESLHVSLQLVLDLLEQIDSGALEEVPLRTAIAVPAHSSG